MFAPFVAQDDLRQLTTDLQGLLPEFGFLDWVPSDPAPLPVLQNVERVNFLNFCRKSVLKFFNYEHLLFIGDFHKVWNIYVIC